MCTMSDRKLLLLLLFRLTSLLNKENNIYIMFFKSIVFVLKTKFSESNRNQLTFSDNGRFKRNHR
jgi:hypothetical protein